MFIVVNFNCIAVYVGSNKENVSVAVCV